MKDLLGREIPIDPWEEERIAKLKSEGQEDVLRLEAEIKKIVSDFLKDLVAGRQPEA